MKIFHYRISLQRVSLPLLGPFTFISPASCRSAREIIGVEPQLNRNPWIRPNMCLFDNVTLIITRN